MKNEIKKRISLYDYDAKTKCLLKKKQTKNHITQEFYSLYRNIIIFVTCHNWLESPKR